MSHRLALTFRRTSTEIPVRAWPGMVPVISIILITTFGFGMPLAWAAPVIHSVTPNEGPVGSLVTIEGQDFGAAPAENIVAFGTLRAIITAATSNSLTVRVPVGTTVHPITVTHEGLIASSPLPFVPTFIKHLDLSTNTFSAPIPLPSRRTPHGILGDVDGDGWLDIVFANYHDNSVSLLRNTVAEADLSTNTFPDRVDLPAGSGPHTPAMADLDGDGRMEVIVPNDFSANVSVYRNVSSPGSLSATSLAAPVSFPTRNNPVHVCATDMDGDGKLDLVVVNAVIGPSTVSVHRNTAVPGSITATSFAAGVHFQTGTHSFWNEVGDLDGDGKPDVVVANVREAALSVLHNTTSVPGSIDSSAFAAVFSLALPERAQTLQLADFDGDGKLDIASAGDAATFVHRNVSTPGVLSAASFAPLLSVLSGGTELKVADFDGDGRPDIAVTSLTSPRMFHIHLNLSVPGNLQFGPRIAVPSGGDRFDVGDLNGDGSPDLVCGADQASGSGLFLIQNTIPVDDQWMGEPFPSIFVHPPNLSATLGGTAAFSVRANGSPPLTYQWRFGETSIPDATNRTLTLSNVGFSNAGSYQVVVANEFGSVTSAVATLTVNYPPALIRVAHVEGPAGNIVVPVELVANGDENAVSFSLQFDTSRLAFVAATLGADAPDASLVINTNSKGRGSVGFSLVQPAGQSFPAGIRQVAAMTLAVLPSQSSNQNLTASSFNTTIEFSDDPVVRRLANPAGSALPAVYERGTLTVHVSALQAGAVETTTGGFAGVPVTLQSLGTENAASFSLAFNPSLLAFAGVEPGAGLPPDAALLVNTNELGAGRLGLSLALPAGRVWSTGAQELLVAQFNVNTVLQPLTTPIQFVDNPIIRQLANRDAQRIPVAYQNGTVSVVTIAFEADVAPRLGGDQSVSVIDWVQIGRFAAALDVAEPGEFQRVDCAPRSSRGNGAISVADWVQAGRYSANLDPITGLGGPAAPAELAPAAAGSAGAGARTGRVVQIGSARVQPGTTLTAPVAINSTGDENALGFSLTFDPARLRYLGAAKAAAVATATVNLNTNRAPNGSLGVAIALPPGTVLAAGSQDLIVLSFAALPEGSGTTLLEFGDAPVLREAASASAGTLPVTYAEAVISLGPPPPAGPTLEIARSGDSVVLFWPAETGFELYSTDAPAGRSWTKVSATPIRIGGEELIALPPTGEQKYFRLRKPPSN